MMNSRIFTINVTRRSYTKINGVGKDYDASAYCPKLNISTSEFEEPRKFVAEPRCVPTHQSRLRDKRAPGCLNRTASLNEQPVSQQPTAKGKNSCAFTQKSPMRSPLDTKGNSGDDIHLSISIQDTNKRRRKSLSSTRKPCAKFTECCQASETVQTEDAPRSFLREDASSLS